MKLRCKQSTVEALLQAHLTYAVIINKDVSVRTVGAIESVFFNLEDARKEAERLSSAYREEHSFIFIDLRSCQGVD